MSSTSPRLSFFRRSVLAFQGSRRSSVTSFPRFSLGGSNRHRCFPVYQTKQVFQTSKVISEGRNLRIRCVGEATITTRVNCCRVVVCLKERDAATTWCCARTRVSNIVMVHIERNLPLQFGSRWILDEVKVSFGCCSRSLVAQGK